MNCPKLNTMQLDSNQRRSWRFVPQILLSLVFLLGQLSGCSQRNEATTMAREDRPIPQETRDLHESIRQRTLDELRTHLDSGADVNAAGRLGHTPLMVAIEAKDLQKLELLLERR